MHLLILSRLMSIDGTVGTFIALLPTKQYRKVKARGFEVFASAPTETNSPQVPRTILSGYVLLGPA